jgi:hypothetical protein
MVQMKFVGSENYEPQLEACLILAFSNMNFPSLYF